MGKKELQYKIFHLDCGRKYFTKDWIVALAREISAAGFNQLQLAFGNNALRFMLDDMTVGNYTSEQVKAAVEAGNAVYSNEHETEASYLTESEMDEIVEAAKAAGVQIVPLFNTPGHMDTVITAMAELGISNPGYHGSKSSVDFDNEEAVAFTKQLFKKYVNYFAGKECTVFNIGSDEYANDVFEKYAGMGFGKLTDTNKYECFIAYVNELADILVKAGITPWTFNDGIYYDSNTEFEINKNIQVCYWSPGWMSYPLAPAVFIAGQGHNMVNTNGDYYYVLGKSDKFDVEEEGLAFAEKFDNTAFSGSVIDNPVGAMFCVWCDYPNAETEQVIAARSRQILRIIGGRMCENGTTAANVSKETVPGGFNADGSIAQL